MNRSLSGLALALLALASGILYFARLRTNPPGFYLDEASIAFNALTISRTGRDEHGVRLPLYFAAFGEYKNPTYIYLLAGVFKLVRPSNVAARTLSATAGYLACVIMGLLAWRITRSRFVGIATFLTAMVTPMLFEISRLVFEVALYPLAIVCFLYAARVAHERSRWSIAVILSLVTTLAAIAYTYSIGRLLGPVLAVSLLVFYTRERRWQIAAAVAGFILVGVLPIFAFNVRHGGALTRHFRFMTYVDARAPLKTLAEFERRYVANILPLGLSLSGDPNPRHHVPGSGGSILLMTFILAALGVIAGLRTMRRDRWLWFLLWGTAVSVVPAALTTDIHHTLRLVAFPIFLMALSISALERRSVRLGLLLALGVFQALFFFARFHTKGTTRGNVFDAGVQPVVTAALAEGSRPIYVPDNGLYVHVYWNAALAGVDRSTFIRTREAPPGAVVIAEREPGPEAVVFSRHDPYVAYRLP